MKVNEIFCSLQGEGYHSGVPAVFVRLSGCNLACPFCDTHHQSGTDMSEEAIAAEAGRHKAPLLVFTGGEPALQLTDSLVERVKAMGFFVCVETNGTLALPEGVDWVTLSPKDAFVGSQHAPVLTHADELKVVFDGLHEPSPYRHIEVRHRFLQPCDTGDAERNAAIVRQTVDYIQRHPEWRLSLQIHKIIHIR